MRIASTGRAHTCGADSFEIHTLFWCCTVCSSSGCCCSFLSRYGWSVLPLLSLFGERCSVEELASNTRTCGEAWEVHFRSLFHWCKSERKVKSRGYILYIISCFWYIHTTDIMCVFVFDMFLKVKWHHLYLDIARQRVTGVSKKLLLLFKMLKWSAQECPSVLRT